MTGDDVCMPSIDGNDYTLCGVAYDAYDSGDSVLPVIPGKPGDRITCEKCLYIIRECKSVRNNKVPK